MREAVVRILTICGVDVIVCRRKENVVDNFHFVIRGGTHGNRELTLETRDSGENAHRNIWVDISGR